MKNDSIWLRTMMHGKNMSLILGVYKKQVSKKDEEYRVRDTYKKTCEILKLAKLLVDVSPAFTQPALLHFSCCIFTLPFSCIWLLPCLRRSSHIWQDIAIKELPVSRCVRTSLSLYTIRERKLQILNWKSRRASCTSFRLWRFQDRYVPYRKTPSLIYRILYQII